MKPDPHRRALAALAVCLLAAAPTLLQAQDVDRRTARLLLENQIDQNFVPGEIIVKMKAARGADAGAAAAAGVSGLDTEAQPTSGGELLMRIAPSVAAALGEDDLEARTLSAIAELTQNPDVEYAQPNYVLQIAAVPNDPRYGEQWHYFDNGDGAGESPGGINLPTAWETTKGSRDVVVAVIDTGILPDHPDIAGSANLIPGFDMISNPFRAKDGDGRDSDPTDPGDSVQARQCGRGQPTRPHPSSWHGSHVAGTVGVGHTDNGVGVAGVNWEVSVMAVRVLGRCGGTTLDVADGIRWAAGLPVPGIPDNPRPADIVNLSLGDDETCGASPVMQNAITDAVAAGTTVVVAAGNSAANAANFSPASCDGVITVAAGDGKGRLVGRYSNYGETIEILAPGGDVGVRPGGVLSMVRHGYTEYNGTSMAAPHVAGVAALLLAEEPDLSPAEVLRRLQANAMPRSEGECSRLCGVGLLDADLWSDKLRISPSSFGVKKGRSREIAAVLVRGGVPRSGIEVRFSSSDPAAVEVTETNTTDADGRAVATVRRLASGEATITARVDGLTGEAPVKVPAVSLLGLLLIAAGALYLIHTNPRPLPASPRQSAGTAPTPGPPAARRRRSAAA